MTCEYHWAQRNPVCLKLVDAGSNPSPTNVSPTFTRDQKLLQRQNRGWFGHSKNRGHTGPMSQRYQLHPAKVSVRPDFASPHITSTLYHLNINFSALCEIEEDKIQILINFEISDTCKSLKHSNLRQIQRAANKQLGSFDMIRSQAMCCRKENIITLLT